MSIYERIRKRRIELGMTQEELAHKIGYTSKSSITKIETGHVDLPQSKIVEFAHALDTNVGYLMGDSRRGSGVFNPDIHSVPILGAIQCGLPTLAEENIEEYANVADLRCDFALRCVGDSMAPTLIDGDLVLLRSQPDVTDGQIAAIRIGEEATLKHLRHTPTGIILIPENPDYPPLTYDLTEDSDIAVIGLAIGLQRIIGRKS